MYPMARMHHIQQQGYPGKSPTNAYMSRSSKPHAVCVPIGPFLCLELFVLVLYVRITLGWVIESRFSYLGEGIFRGVFD